jgi:hypothetical protein
MMHFNPGAKRPSGPADPRGEIRNPDAPTILSPSDGRGQGPHANVASHVQPATSGDAPTVNESDGCHDKASLAQFLRISVRSLDRAIAAGALLEPDAWYGRSPRWLRQSILRWLKTRPRLPGRRGGGL